MLTPGAPGCLEQQPDFLYATCHMGLEIRVEPITSCRNPIVSRFRKIARQKTPTESTALLEGPRLIEDALAAGVRLEVVAVSTLLMSDVKKIDLIDRLMPAAQIIPVSPIVMDALSPVSSPSGMVALATVTPGRIDDIADLPRPILVGLHGVQDPGNVGAVIRAVEAGGASGIITVGGADPYGWKALRGSMGSIFRIPVASSLDPRAIGREAISRGWRVIATVPRGGTCLTEIDLREPCLLWIGSEGKGLDHGMINSADEVLSIPMREPVDSLNLAVTAALIIYEAARQRGKFKPDTALREDRRGRFI